MVFYNLVLVYCFFLLQTSLFAVAGFTFNKLNSAKQSLLGNELLTDDFGVCGGYLFAKENPFFNEALQKEENETHTGITYGRGERLLPKKLYQSLATHFTNKCAPERRCV